MYIMLLRIIRIALRAILGNHVSAGLFLDVMRNAYAQTAVAPYSLRPNPGAPVATPLEWDEVSDPRLHSQRYNLKNIFRRLDKRGDPWQDIWKHPQSIRRAA